MIISFSGKRRSGKDTAASFLKGFKRYAFADYLKEGCSEAFQLPLAMFHDDKLKDEAFETPITLCYWQLNEIAKAFDFEPTEEFFRVGFANQMISPRNLLQFVGTDLIRKTIEDSFWIDATVERLRKEPCNVVVADSRFSNERNLLKSLGAILVLIKRGPDSIDGHSSENDLGKDEDYDYVIENNGTLEELQQKIEHLQRIVVV